VAKIGSVSPFYTRELQSLSSFAEKLNGQFYCSVDFSVYTNITQNFFGRFLALKNLPVSLTCQIFFCGYSVDKNLAA